MQLSILLLLFFMLTIQCNQKTATKNIVSVKDTIFQQGIASWYGPGFHGRKTASGEPFDTTQLTAAHKFLKFDLIVKVTNIENNKSVIVRINDRGPVSPKRIIDLSQAAAKKIDIIDKGLAMVNIKILSESKHPHQQLFDIVKNYPNTSK